MTSEPKRIQRRRANGWKKPDNTIDVTRPGRWGNPFIVGKHGKLEECIDMFEKMLAGFFCVSVDPECFASQKKFMKNINTDIVSLRGKNLMCWCREGKPCHGDILLRVANA